MMVPARAVALSPLAGALLLAACVHHSPSIAVPSLQSAGDIQGIRFHRHGCLGTCPDYSYDLRRDGTAEYVGMGWTPIIGVYTATIEPHDFEGLARQVFRADLFTLDSLPPPSRDIPYLELGLEIDGGSRCVSTRAEPRTSSVLVFYRVVTDVERVARRLSWERKVQP